MKNHIRSADPRGTRWQPPIRERLRHPMRFLRRLMARINAQLEDIQQAVLAERCPATLALIPIRAVQPQSTRRLHRRLE